MDGRTDFATFHRYGQPGSVSEEPVPGADPRHPTDGLDLDSARVYDAFPTHEACTVDDLVAESGLSATQVLGSLAMLDLHGLAVKEGTIWRRLKPSATRDRG